MKGKKYICTFTTGKVQIMICFFYIFYIISYEVCVLHQYKAVSKDLCVAFNKTLSVFGAVLS